MRKRPPALAALVLSSLAIAGCASTLTDELAVTAQKTREPTIRATEKLADTLAHVNKALVATSDPERGLSASAARVTSSTAGAIDRLADLVKTIDDVARRESDATRDQRLKIMANVSGITSSVETLVGRVEQVSRDWNDHAKELRAQESRAMKALADLSESTARASADVSRATATAEPHLESSAKSVAAILADVAKMTNRLSSDEATSRTAVALDVSIGAAAALVVVLVVIGVKVAFRRAVLAEVAARTSGRGS
jgi:outer membrane murein-binding lipoprotein Lpp